MRKGGGKTKGGNFERETGQALSLWLSGGARKDLLCRTVGSGAQFTRAAGMAGRAGDLMANHPTANIFCEKFVVECKHWRDLELIRLLFKEGELYTALLKVQEEASHESKHWWLVAKQNNRPALVLMSAKKILPFLSPEHVILSDVAIFRFLDFMARFDANKFLEAMNEPSAEV